MKFGKEFQHILSDSHFPEEWKSSAIEYRQLKKLIKDVVSELSSMGLSPDVLNKLLITEDDGSNGSSPHRDASVLNSPNGRGSGAVLEVDPNEVFEFEFESDEASPPSLHARPMSSPARSKQQVLADPFLSDHQGAFPDGLDLPSLSRSMEAGPSSLTSHHQRKFRVRLLSESQPNAPVVAKDLSSAAGTLARPMSVMSMIGDGGVNGLDGINPGTPVELGSSLDVDGSSGMEKHVRGRRVVRRSMNQGPGARVKAEYVLGGDSQHPHPQLVLHLPASSTSSSRATSSTPSAYSDSTISEDDTDDEEHGAIDRSRPYGGNAHEPIHRSSLLLQSAANSPATIRAVKSPPDPPDIGVVPASPTLQRITTAMSPIFALASGASIDDGLGDLSLGDSAIVADEDDDGDEGSDSMFRDIPVPPRDPAHGPNRTPTDDATPSADRERAFVIPLSSDQAFFDLLTAALTSLSTFHADQQEKFRQSVTTLCTMISRSVQPTSSSRPLKPTTTSSPSPSSRISLPPNPLIHPTAKPNTKDLYAWREIFTLWIESEIFESSAERTRGERTVEQAEARLQKFAAEVTKRGLGDRRTLRGKRSRGAWEEFLRLNVLLLDLKRFQMANISAARKILKKHDKRTALTASSGFQSFVRSTLSAVSSDGNITTWTFYNTSLPHVLLASLTDTLLPLDDYACLICTSIAFKPIRLSCQHLFCVRCLVKMQRAGKAECPLCRSKVVLQADKTSLDTQVMDFMREWFPKEVKAKQKENEEEIYDELRHSGQIAPIPPGGEKCVIM